MANPFVHVELDTTDLAKAKSFYQSLFAWTLKDEDMGGGMIYTMIDVGDGTGGGMMKHPMPAHGRCGCPTCWWTTSPPRLPRQVARRHRGAGRDGGDGRGLALHHHRSDRRRAGAVAAQGEVAGSGVIPPGGTSG